MKRTAILADEAVMTELEALERYVSERTAKRKRRLPSFVGIGHGSGEDVASRAHEIVRGEMAEKLWAEIEESRRSSKQSGG